MRVKSLMITLLLICCSEEKTSVALSSPSFVTVTYLTLTNENTEGGSQFAYLQSDVTEDLAIFCFCLESCSREIINVFALEYNEDTTEFRFKFNPSDEFQYKSSRDWCTRSK